MWWEFWLDKSVEFEAFSKRTQSELKDGMEMMEDARNGRMKIPEYLTSIQEKLRKYLAGNVTNPASTLTIE